MKNPNLFFTALFAVVITACGSKSSDRQGPAENSVPVVVQGEQTQTLAEPKVNILIVVDNSGSMKNYQDKLARNMKQFAEHFFNQNRINFRIGIVPIYDSKYLNDTTVYNSGVRKMNPLGELVALKGLGPSDPGSKLFISRETPNPEKVLEATVALGTQWGPEAEESFSPVLAVADSGRNAQKNDHFYWPDASLAVIFLTDADDVTPGLSGEEFYDRLLALKNGDRSKVLIAAALPDLNNNSADCTKDGRGPLQSFPALLAVSGALFADLCSNNFGSKLADFGKSLVQRVGTQKVSIPFTPDIATLEVTFGLPNSRVEDRIVIARGPNGYLFDPNLNEVIISPGLQLPQLDQGVIFVKAIPANLANGGTGRLTQI